MIIIIIVSDRHTKQSEHNNKREAVLCLSSGFYMQAHTHLQTFFPVFVSFYFFPECEFLLCFASTKKEDKTGQERYWNGTMLLI